jgi:hypothetical protein
MKTLLLLPFSFLAASFTFFIQDDPVKFIDGLPADLNKSKVIFLRYDSVEINAEDKKAVYYQKKHNKNVPDANKDLAEALKKYPYEYIVASRKDIDALKAKGYKYVLDSQAYKNMAYGFRQDQSSKSAIISYEYKLYFQDLVTNDAYVVSKELTENQLYFPKYVVNNMVLPKVKKKFDK